MVYIPIPLDSFYRLPLYLKVWAQFQATSQITLERAVVKVEFTHTAKLHQRCFYNFTHKDVLSLRVSWIK